MNYSQTKTVKVSDITHKHLSRLGKKGEPFDLIIARLIQEHLVFGDMPRDIKKIRELCGDRMASELSFDEKVEEVARIFGEIDFDFGIYPDWEIHRALETAMDEDLVGCRDDIPLAEIVVNCYCLYLEMPSPTFNKGLMISPLSEH